MKAETYIPAPEEVETVYPCLKRDIGTRQVVLFTSFKTGTLLYAGETDRYVGEHRNDWPEQHFDILPAGSEVTITQ